MKVHVRNKSSPGQPHAVAALQKVHAAEAVHEQWLFKNPPAFEGNCTAIDSGADRSCVNQGCATTKVHGEEQDHDGKNRKVVDAFTAVKAPSEQTTLLCVVRVNQAFHDAAGEAIATPEQTRWNDITVNTTAIIHGGKQNAEGADFEMPLHCNGETTVFFDAPPKDSHKHLPKAVPTSPQPCRPEDCMLQKLQEDGSPVGDLGTDDGDLDGELHGDNTDARCCPLGPEPECSLHNALPQCRRRCIWDPIKHNWKPHQLKEWQRCFGLVNEETLRKTFMATTQFVPSVQHENELFPKQAQGARFPILSCLRLKEDVHCDIVESPQTGKQKLKKALLFCACKSKATALCHSLS